MGLKKINELFEVSYGNSFELNRLDICSENQEGINFVSRTVKNNGVSAIVRKLDKIKPFPSGLITVALGGSVLETFLQPKPFYTGFHVMVLCPLFEMSETEKLFYAFCIRKNKYRYSYGRQANRTIKEIKIPENIPQEWLDDISKIDFNRKIDQPLSNKQIKLNTSTWNWFTYDELFEIERGRGPRIKELTGKGNTPFITSTDQNNGFTGFTDEKPIHKGNVISVNRNGSVGESFYQPVPFCSTEDVHIFNPKFELNQYIAMFFITLIRKEKYRFGYGRKWGIARMKKTKIKLPVDSIGNPEWKFMEDYIKSLPYSANL